MDFCTIIKRLENQPGAYFQLHEEYAEPGYENPKSQLIVTGDWNPRSWDEPIPKKDLTMPRVGAILEKLGAVLEWEDEWCSCEGCQRLFRISPNSYSWLPSYWDSNGCGLYCQQCVLDDPEDYLESLEGNSGAANTLDLDLKEHEYKKIPSEYENGFYGGQNDDPKAIAENLRKFGVKRFIFEIDSTGQFDVHFSVWVHESEIVKLDPLEINDFPNLGSRGVDPMIASQAALGS